MSLPNVTTPLYVIAKELASEAKVTFVFKLLGLIFPVHFMVISTAFIHIDQRHSHKKDSISGL